jgi:hypothetical protein
MCVDNGPRINAYHLTTTARAINIAKYGFPIGNNRQVTSDIYFTRSLKEASTTDTSHLEAIVYVRLNLGRVLQVQNRNELDFSMHNAQPNLPQTLECIISGDIKVRFPGQIENWVIVLFTRVDKEFNPSYYDGCI